MDGEQVAVINEIGFSGNETGMDPIDGFFSDKEIVEEPAQQPEKGEKKEPVEVEKQKPAENKTAAPVIEKKVEGVTEPKFSDFVNEKFLKKGEDGSSSFDSESALSFLKGKDNLAFKYVPPVRAPAKAETVNAEPVNPYKKQIEEERQYKTTLAEQANMWPKKYAEGIKAGYSAEDAIRYANGATNTWLEDQIAEWKYKRESESAEARGKEELTEREHSQLRQKAAVNEQAYINHLGGQKQYDEFMFGKTVDGKWVKGYATDYIYKVYDLMNGDKKSHTKADYERWWDKYASEPSNLALAYEVGMAKLQQELLPHLIQRGVEKHKAGERQKGLAKRRDGGTVRTASVETNMNDLNSFFQDPGQRGQGIETI